MIERIPGLEQVLTGLAASAGGWWSRDAGNGALARITGDDDVYYRAHHAYTRNGCSYDEVRPAYVVGQLAAYDPGFAGEQWSAIEPVLERGWVEAGRRDWDEVSELAHDAWTRVSKSDYREWGNRLISVDQTLWENYWSSI